MESILLALTIGILNIGCFYIGAKTGQAVVKGEPIKTPSINPIKAVKERIDKKEADKEQNRIDTIMRNIERYDGTGNGQEDVPRG